MDPSTPACSQSVDSGSTSLGSTVNAVPITNVSPINRYRPIIQAFAPIVQSECDDRFGDDDVDGGLYGSDYNNYDGSILGSAYGSGSQLYRRDSAFSDPSSDPSLSAPYSSLDSASSDFDMGQQDQQQSDCDTSVPYQNVDLGSSVDVIPSTQVAPSTFYRPQVSSLESDIQAAPAQSSSLPQQNVDLGSNVSIQPITHVLPQTTYQPQVHQMTTSIEAAPQQDQPLPESSVHLGSNVLITPTVDPVVTLVDLHPTPLLLIRHCPTDRTEARNLAQLTKTLIKIIKATKATKAIQVIKATEAIKTRPLDLAPATRAITKARHPMDLPLMLPQVKDAFKNV
ncbi:hypothetical protein BGX26_003108 [Mortierella sp. AD094]|nr:hypothetical protein BGX26_003108 [Mortierella sp. AD094]